MPALESRKNGENVYNKLVGHVCYCNAVHKRTDGRFILVNEERLKRRLNVHFTAQKNYILREIKGEFPEEKQNSLKQNASKAKLKKIAEEIPYKEEIADEIVDSMDTSLKKGAKTIIYQKNLRRFGIGMTSITEKAKKYLGDKLSHELSNSKGNIHSTTVERIQQILYDSFEQGRTYTETSKLIQEQADAGVFSQERGELIAVREIGIAYEEGTYEPMEVLQEENPDRKVLKLWSTVGDDRVTEAHAQNEDEGWVELDFVYEASGGDDHAPGSDNPRCRCTQLYDIK